jgi:hypothetical protein
MQRVTFLRLPWWLVIPHTRQRLCRLAHVSPQPVGARQMSRTPLVSPLSRHKHPPLLFLRRQGHNRTRDVANQPSQKATSVHPPILTPMTTHPSNADCFFPDTDPVFWDARIQLDPSPRGFHRFRVTTARFPDDDHILTAPCRIAGRLVEAIILGNRTVQGSEMTLEIEIPFLFS